MNSGDETRVHRIWAIAVTTMAVVLIAGIAIGCTVASTRAAQRDEAIKSAAAENGCNYANGVMTCIR